MIFVIGVSLNPDTDELTETHDYYDSNFASFCQYINSFFFGKNIRKKEERKTVWK